MSIPTKGAVLQWIADNPALTSKRDIAKAFGIKGAARIDLKRLLKELEEEGHLTKRKRSYEDPNRLPPVSILKPAGVDADGDLFLAPADWKGDGPEPRILYIPKDGDPDIGPADRLLVRLTEVEGEDHTHEGRLIRRIGTGPRRTIGVFRVGTEGGRLLPVDKGVDREWVIGAGDTGGARDGELVEAEVGRGRTRMGLPRAKIVTRLGDPGAAKAVSLIAIHQHGLRDAFPEEAVAEAEAAQPPTLGNRTDLRDLPLITIDPSDARDHDDACCAAPDDDPSNPGGHVLWVAIADVAAYVRPSSALDREARERGNSTYFPDRVVPMLPDALSGDLCSLHEGVERACIAVRIVIDAEGEKRSQAFHRGLMRSPAALHYEEVQAAIDGAPTERTAPHLGTLRALYAAYGALKEARTRRAPLDLDLPERKIALSDAGEVTSVAFKDRLDAHRLIEEFMILANVAAAEELERRRTPLLYRVHEEPPEDKLDSLRETAKASGFSLPKGQVMRPALLNGLLHAAAETDLSELISMSTLRAMTQAYYAPQNLGHFGLALRAYGHFTSPIRRYADLIVHRALITAHGWGDDGLSPWDLEHLEATAKAISEAERRSMVAERDTNDRYLAAFLADRIGAEVTGRISGVQSFGAFVRLDDTGADGLIPVRSLGAEFFRHDRDAQTLTGTDSGIEIGLGQRVTVRLAEAAPVTGGLVVELLGIEGEPLRRTARRPAKTGKVGFKKRNLRKAPRKRR
ncbi:ribonuclease R [Jannaschia pagri]|uniref:Ribonuclease R n=1 Tax=Jannaschia pagri TaxID=2829797 RepID=A0ABQ4NKS3_9RHOB|nr:MULTISPECIES: ribonuclease R [unclassified Jannaschia]GIT90967.1 ribonuclease R [Jannaschia sp. AI_61]GIT94799.1 ribonuclease R [Jannaschia sp. AI_62]